MRPTHERVRELLHYDPETGVFTWLVRTSNRIKVGDVAGSPHIEGYWVVGFDGRAYRAHNLVWLWMTGEWPTMDIDHIDGVRDNNRWANLRLSTRSENMMNVVAPSKNNTSGFRGVCRNGSGWRADITVRGTQKNLGTFTTPEEAHAAYMQAKAELHGVETYQGRLV